MQDIFHLLLVYLVAMGFAKYSIAQLIAIKLIIIVQNVFLLRNVIRIFVLNDSETGNRFSVVRVVFAWNAPGIAYNSSPFIV